MISGKLARVVLDDAHAFERVVETAQRSARAGGSGSEGGRDGASADLISRFGVDVLGEIVEPKLDRREPPVPALDLLVEADLSAHGLQRLFLDAVALKDAAP